MVCDPGFTFLEEGVQGLSIPFPVMQVGDLDLFLLLKNVFRRATMTPSVVDGSSGSGVLSSGEGGIRGALGFSR